MNANVPSGVSGVPGRVLLVDDDLSLRNVTERVLVRFGYCVDCAADGQAGWELLCERHFRLLITDNDMPRMTGIDLVRTLRRSGSSLPVILMTAVLPEAALLETASLKIAATLLKPFGTADLLATVQTTLDVSSG